MFRFNFTADLTSEKGEDAETREVQCAPSKEIFPDENIKAFALSATACEATKCGDVTIKHVLPKTVLQYIIKNNIQSSVLAAESSHSDLLTGFYEGGLKVWECTFDLLNFFNAENCNFDQKQILDLGCGGGLLGIYALFKRACGVYFQDYNEEVLEYITIPNVLMNHGKSEGTRFFSGDWSYFLDVCEREQFDYILSSETIYNTNNYKKLIEIFRKCLKKSGIIYIAAKLYYFGVGGGLRQFQEAILKEQVFDVATVWGCNAGIKRQILKITFLR